MGRVGKRGRGAEAFGPRPVEASRKNRRFLGWMEKLGKRYFILI